MCPLAACYQLIYFVLHRNKCFDDKVNNTARAENTSSNALVGRMSTLRVGLPRDQGSIPGSKNGFQSFPQRQNRLTDKSSL
jgi:hypothetical protein